MLWLWSIHGHHLPPKVTLQGLKETRAFIRKPKSNLGKFKRDNKSFERKAKKRGILQVEEPSNGTSSSKSIKIIECPVPILNSTPLSSSVDVSTFVDSYMPDEYLQGQESISGGSLESEPSHILVNFTIKQRISETSLGNSNPKKKEKGKRTVDTRRTKSASESLSERFVWHGRNFLFKPRVSWVELWGLEEKIWWERIREKGSLSGYNEDNFEICVPKTSRRLHETKRHYGTKGNGQYEVSKKSKNV